MKLFTFLLVVCSTFSYAGSASAGSNDNNQAVAVDLLLGSDDTSGVRLAYRPHTGKLKNVTFLGDLNIYWEASINVWNYNGSGQNQTNYAIAFSPVIGKTFYHLNGVHPVRWEFGIGVSLVEDTEFAGKDLGTHFQFEDRLGVAIDFGDNQKQSLALRYMHYSNAGLSSSNPGLDFLSLSYASHF